MKRKPIEELGISDDLIFSYVMQDKETCRKFLSTVLGKDIPDVRFTIAQRVIDLSADAKSVRLDVYADDDEDSCDCEMQTTENENLPKRSRYYLSSMDMVQIQKGDDYLKLKKSYVIFICTFDPFGKDVYRYTFTNRSKEYPDLELGDEAYRIFLNTEGHVGDISGHLRKMLKYFRTSVLDESSTTPLTIRMDKLVREAKSDPEWRYKYFTDPQASLWDCVATHSPQANLRLRQ